MLCIKILLLSDHFKNEAYIFAHCFNTENNIDDILQLIKAKNFASYNFYSTHGDCHSQI